MSSPSSEAIEGLFVTGTDTGVGKTLVGAALVYLLRQKGLPVAVSKPLESGVADPSGLGEDGRLLQWAAQSPACPDRITPYRLREPLAPATAARRDGVAVDWEPLPEQVRRAGEGAVFQLAEGAGGLLVPLSGDRLVADLAAALEWPLLVVARAGLGTINHTLLTLEAAASRGLPVAGWIINGMPPDPGVAERLAASEIARLTDVPCWGVLPRVAGTDVQKVAAAARQMAAWPRVHALCTRLAA